MEKIAKINKFYKNKNILITGNTGFIGSWLTLCLLKYKCKITGISKDQGQKTGIFNIFNLKNKINFFQFDLKDNLKVKNFFKKKKFDIIIHLAAEPLVLDGLTKPSKIIKNNIISTLNLIENVRNYKNFFINFTTDKVYLNNDKTSKYFRETDILTGDDPYSYSKVCSDMMTKMWVKNFNNIKCINIRCGNVVGGGDWGKNRIIPDIINSIYKKKKLTIRNLNSTRPWVQIIELCSIIILLIKKKYTTKKIYDDFNISPKKNGEKNIKWIIKYFEKNLKIKLKYKVKKNYKEKTNLKLNGDKIRKILDFNYSFNEKQRFKITMEWYKIFYTNKREIINQTNNDLKMINKILSSK